MLTGTNLTYTKQYNLRIVHEVIRLFGPLSRADVARRTQLTGQTISNLVRELIDSGLVYEAERRSEGRGAPSMALALNPDGAYAVGLDLAGNVRQRVFMEVDDTITPEQALERMAAACETLIERQGLSRGQVW